MNGRLGAWGPAGAKQVVCLDSGHFDVHWAPGFYLPCFYLPSLHIWKLSYCQNKAQGNLFSYSFGRVPAVSI